MRVSKRWMRYLRLAANDQTQVLVQIIATEYTVKRQMDCLFLWAPLQSDLLEKIDTERYLTLLYVAWNNLSQSSQIPPFVNPI